MKKYFYLPLFILLALALASCQKANPTQSEATSEALNNQVNSLKTQLTQQAGSFQSTQEAIKTTLEKLNESVESMLPTGAPSALPTTAPTATSVGSAVNAPALIFSGSGLITPWTNTTYYPKGLFGTANVHMICDPNDLTDGEIWIDNENFKLGCSASSESWFPWKQELTVGSHDIYSKYENDRYEFWTIGGPPFTIRNIHERSDFMFRVYNEGEYVLSANLIDGAFNVYLTCQGAQNFNFNIALSTTKTINMKPATCELLIRDSPPGTLYPGEIEVSFAKK